MTILPSRYDGNAGTYTSCLGKPGVKHFIVPQKGSGRNVYSETYEWSALELYKLKGWTSSDPRFLAAAFTLNNSDPSSLVYLIGQVWRTDEVFGNINGVLRMTVICYSTL